MLILYLILVLISVMFFILYVGSFSLYLLAFIVLIGISLFITQFYLSRKLKIDFINNVKTTTAGNELPVDIKIINPTIIPVANMTITVEYATALDGRINRTKINTPVYPKETQLLTMKISSQHYGNIRLKLGKCYIFDILRLFKFKVRYAAKEQCVKQTSMTVFPEYAVLDNPISNYNDCGLETDEYSKDKKGDDPSQIFDIHEYIAGDKINRIHWKLSAKQDKTMVKDYSLPLTDSVTIIINLDVDTKNENAEDMYDAIIETAASVSKYLTDNEFSHRAIWFDSAKNDIDMLNVTDDESHILFISSILQVKVGNDSQKAMLDMLEDSMGRKCGHMLYISSKLDENVVNYFSESSYAQRYSCLVSSQENDITMLDSISDIVDVTYIRKNYVSESIMDLYL